MAKALANRNVKYISRKEPTGIFFLENERTFADISRNSEFRSNDFASVKRSKSPNCSKVVLAVVAGIVTFVIVSGLITGLIVFTAQNDDEEKTTVPPETTETTRTATETTSIASPLSTDTTSTKTTSVPPETTETTRTATETTSIASPLSTSTKTTSEPNSKGWSNWGLWTQCSATCDNGFQVRYRSCNEDLSSMCQGSFVERRLCSGIICPVYAKWTTWASWGSCDVTCGGGLSLRTRTCLKATALDLDCVGEDSQTQICSNWTCPDCTQTCPVGILNDRCDTCICENSDITGRIFARATGNPIRGAALYAQTAPTHPLTQSNATGFFSLHSICTSAKLIVTKEGFIDTAVDVNDTYIEIHMARIVKPFLTETPQSKYRLTNESVTLCCKASGSPEILNYEWFKDTILLDQSLKINETQILLTNLRTTDSGKYQCRANSNAGAIMSAVAELTVKDSPDDFCQDALEQKTIWLPYDCIQSSSNSSTYNVGDCVPKKCKTVNAKNAGVCREKLSSCCSPKEFKIETIDCLNYTLDIFVVKSCSCAACAPPKIKFYGVATGLEDGLPVRFASVYVNGEFVSYTNANGLFRFASNNTVARLILNIQDDFYKDYLPAIKVIETGDDMSGIFHINIKMIKASEPIEIDSTVANTLKAGPSDGANNSNVQLSIPANAFYYENGSMFSGKLAARLTYLDPSNTSNFDNIPGEFSYVDDEGQLRNLATLGVFNLYFEDKTGNNIILNEAVDAFIPHAIGNNATYRNFKVWILNSQTGTWESEGENIGKRRKKRDTRTWIGELSDVSVTHWYNYDKVDEIAENLCYFNFRLFKDRFLTSTDVNDAYINLNIHIKRGKILHIIYHFVHLSYAKYMCATAACENENAYITGQYNQDTLYVGSPHPASNIDYTISSDERVLTATMTSSSSGPFFKNQSKCEASYPPVSYLRFFRGITNFEWKFRDDRSDCDRDKHLNKLEALRFWYPKHSITGKLRVCFVKVDVNFDTDVRINENEMKIRVFSYGGTNSKIKGKILGIHEAVVSYGKRTYCIEYRCSGSINICDSTVQDNTKVKIILEYPKSRAKCLVDLIAPDLSGPWQNPNYENKDGLFSFIAPYIDGGPDYGLYTVNDYFVDVAKNHTESYCSSGSLNDNPDSDIGYAVSFKCRVRN